MNIMLTSFSMDSYKGRSRDVTYNTLVLARCAQALWKDYDPDTERLFIERTGNKLVLNL